MRKKKINNNTPVTQTNTVTTSPTSANASTRSGGTVTYMTADEYQASQKKTNTSVILDANQKACANNIINNLRYIDITCYPRRPHVNQDWIAIRASTYSTRQNYLDEPVLELDRVPENEVKRYGFDRCDGKVVSHGGITSVEPSSYEVGGVITEKKHTFIHTDDIPGGLPPYVVTLVKTKSTDKLTASDAATICSTWNKINNFIKAH